MLKRLVLILLVTLCAAAAFGQSCCDDPLNRNFDDPWGDPNANRTCWRCVFVSDLDAYCSGAPIGGNNYGGMSACQASGHVTPPMYASCTLSGYFCYGAPIGQFELQWRKGKALRYALVHRCSMRSLI